MWGLLLDSSRDIFSPKKSFSSWWLNRPIWKICSSKLDHFPNFQGENKKKIGTTTECWSCGCCGTPRSKADLDDGQQLNTLLHGQIVRLIGFLPCILLENTSKCYFWAEMFTKNRCIWWFYRVEKVLYQSRQSHQKSQLISNIRAT